MALYEDGKEISRDSHLGFSGDKLEGVEYKLDIKHFKKDSIYTIKARLNAIDGIDSFGQVKNHPLSNDDF